MKIYKVGGAVRDALLGLPVQDQDYVVVGATPEEMTALGFVQVGKDFPVFLHPKTKEEYALARCERKVGVGYRGFVFDVNKSVTLEQDLLRRDLTINAIAQSMEGEIIDPFHGRFDLEKRILRHVSDAFIEDPVRILRVARFMARLGGAPFYFTLAQETMKLMQEMVIKNELETVAPERVWQEIARGLMEMVPSKMNQVLDECGALDKIFGDVHVVVKGRLLDALAMKNVPLSVRFAAMVCALEKELERREDGIVALKKNLRIPLDCSRLAILAAREYEAVMRIKTLPREQILALIMRCSALRKLEEFHSMLYVIRCLDRDRKGEDISVPLPQESFLKEVSRALSAINEGEIAQQISADGVARSEKIKFAIQNARLELIRRYLVGEID
jgi:tRNA nucleotidyltransferase (CCA-adding enzyme)